MHFIHVMSSPTNLVTKFEDLARGVDGTYQQTTYPASVAISTAPPDADATPTPTPPPDESGTYTVSTFTKKHFITRHLDISATITGYNDVTSKLGAKRLVVTGEGKPIVCAGIVIEADDVFLGDVCDLTIMSDTIPDMVFGGDALDISRIAENTYKTSIDLDAEGVYYLSDYGIAVNYPVEYLDVGMNPDVEKVIQLHGGRVYNESECACEPEDIVHPCSARTVPDRGDRQTGAGDCKKEGCVNGLGRLTSSSQFRQARCQCASPLIRQSLHLRVYGVEMSKCPCGVARCPTAQP
jgi:hypothetical protein